MSLVKLLTKEGNVVEKELKLAQESGLIKTMLDD
jgi:hypothetical protein